MSCIPKAPSVIMVGQDHRGKSVRQENRAARQIGSELAQQRHTDLDLKRTSAILLLTDLAASVFLLWVWVLYHLMPRG